MSNIVIENHGPLILSSNYWESEMAKAGMFFVSVNAGAFRLLLPPSSVGELAEMRTAKGVAVSRGPWPDMKLADAFSILFDDESPDPYTLVASPESFDRLPTAENTTGDWVFSVWTWNRPGKPHKSLERPCRYRLSTRLPDLRPWEAR